MCRLYLYERSAVSSGAYKRSQNPQSPIQCDRFCCLLLVMSECALHLRRSMHVVVNSMRSTVKYYSFIYVYTSYTLHI